MTTTETIDRTARVRRRTRPAADPAVRPIEAVATNPPCPEPEQQEADAPDDAAAAPEGATPGETPPGVPVVTTRPNAGRQPLGGHPAVPPRRTRRRRSNSGGGIGTQLLHAIVTENNETMFMILGPDHFVSNEIEAFEFFSRYYRDHSALPTFEVMVENGHRLNPASGTASYHLRQLQRRAVHNAIQSNQRALMDAFEARNTEESTRLVAQMNEDVQRAQIELTDQFRISTAAELMDRELPDTRWIVPGFVPEGLTLLAAKPKTLKSYLSLDMLHAVATGTDTLGADCDEGDVLYVCLEGGEHTLQTRLREIAGSDQRPERLDYMVDCPPLSDGGLELIERWLRDHPGARLVVIDTFARVRKIGRSGTFSYWEDVRDLTPLCKMGYDHGVGILAVHHCKKESTQDPLDEVSGSNGLSGTPDMVLVMRRQRGNPILIFLHRQGRVGGQEQEFALEWHPETHRFTVEGDAGRFRRSHMQVQIMRALEESAAAGQAIMGYQEVADAAEIENARSVRSQLFRLRTLNFVQQRGRNEWYALSAHVRHLQLDPGNGEDQDPGGFGRPIPVRRRTRPAPESDPED